MQQPALVGPFPCQPMESNTSKYIILNSSTMSKHKPFASIGLLCKAKQRRHITLSCSQDVASPVSPHRLPSSLQARRTNIQFIICLILSSVRESPVAAAVRPYVMMCTMWDSKKASSKQEREQEKFTEQESLQSKRIIPSMSMHSTKPQQLQYSSTPRGV